MLTEEMVARIRELTGCSEDDAQELCNAVDPDEYGIIQSRVNRHVADATLAKLLEAPR